MPLVRLWCSFFLIGVSFGIGPCLASCGPLLLSYAAAVKKTWVAAIGTYLLFSLGRILVYLAVAEAVYFFGHIISQDTMGVVHSYFTFGGGLFIAALGVLMCMGSVPDHGWCRKAQSFFLARDAKTVVVLGMIIGILPCAPLLSVASYIGFVAKHWGDSLYFALAFGLGTVVSPLLALMAVSGVLPKFFSQQDRWYAIFNRACSLLIVLLGLNLMRRAF